jgi:uncharacterized radical SAM superfamily Fe-S cluster-containing enzyme
MTGDVRFNDPGTGGEPAMNDQFPDLIEGFAETVSTVVGFNTRRPFIANNVGWHDPMNSPISCTKLYAEPLRATHSFFMVEGWKPYP